MTFLVRSDENKKTFNLSQVFSSSEPVSTSDTADIVLIDTHIGVMVDCPINVRCDLVVAIATCPSIADSHDY